jgi:hypothetical protein
MLNKGLTFGRLPQCQTCGSVLSIAAGIAQHLYCYPCSLGQQRNVYTPQEKRTVTESKPKTADELFEEIEAAKAAHLRTIEFARDTIREARETIKREQAAYDALPVAKRRAKKPKTTAGLPDAADIAHPADVPGQTMFVHLDE